MKRFITKYCLTSGISEEDLNLASSKGLLINTNCSNCYHDNKDCFEDKNDALADAEKRRLRKLESLKKQIKKLENLKFD